MPDTFYNSKLSSVSLGGRSGRLAIYILPILSLLPHNIKVVQHYGSTYICLNVSIIIFRVHINKSLGYFFPVIIIHKSISRNMPHSIYSPINGCEEKREPFIIKTCRDWAHLHDVQGSPKGVCYSIRINVKIIKILVWMISNMRFLTGFAFDMFAKFCGLLFVFAQSWQNDFDQN